MPNSTERPPLKNGQEIRVSETTEVGQLEPTEGGEREELGQAEYHVGIRSKEPYRSLVDTLPFRIALVLLSFGIFLALWQVLTVLINSQTILSGPVPVIKALVALLAGYVPIGMQGMGNIYTSILTTLEIIGAGFAFSLVGVPIGLVMGRWKAAEFIIDPWINALYSIPMVALIPILYVLIGSGFWAAVFIAFILSVFTVIVNTYSGVKYTSSSLAEVGKTFGASEFQFLGKIIFPASLPDIVAGMRLGLGRAVLGAVVAEALLTRTDLGQLMLTFNEYLDTPDMMAVIFIIAGLGIIALQTPKLLERRLFKWKESERLSRGLKR